MAYVLPGGGYEKKDLGAISEAADVACKDGKLMELAWEVNIPMPAALEASVTTGHCQDVCTAFPNSWMCPR